jgi:hypothetical protein
MTKEEFLERVRQDPWVFPLPLAEIPLDWVAAAWALEEYRDALVSVFGRNISKAGKIAPSREFSDLLARSVSTQQLLELYRVLRRCADRNEEEWRESFETAFPACAAALPVPLARQWEQASDPEAMVDMLLEVTPRLGWERKVRLFQVACCRRIWALLDGRARTAVETAERYADGSASDDELAAAHRRAADAFQEARRAGRGCAFAAAFEASAPDVDPATVAASAGAALALEQSGNDVYDERYDPALARERPEQARLLREIFGNPFRGAYVEPDWLSQSDQRILRLAQEIYGQRTFALLPELGARLAEAGCRHASILDHCRQAQEHVLGCWVLDLLRGQSVLDLSRVQS